MLKKIRENVYVRKHFKVSLPDIRLVINNLRQKTNVLIICPQPTKGNWLGVNIGTKSIFDDVFEIPQYFSHSVYNKKELELIDDFIIESKFSQVIFSGFSPYFYDMILDIKKKSKIQIGVIFHGALSELAHSSTSFFKITQLFKNENIDKIGFIKKDLANYFNQLYSTKKCFHLLYKHIISASEASPSKSSIDKLDIGIFGIHNFNKNTFNQVSAALLIENANIHVLKSNSFSFLQSDDRIIAHPAMPHQDFIQLLSSMTVNTHISFSESWGQIVTESLSMGVPCLTSNNNGIFEFDDYLAKKLIVNQYDNPIAIAKQIEDVLQNREEISKRGTKYIKELNIISKEKLEEFVK
jgi:glycosyltransferase involved in cell wall biosynthesis